MARSSRVTRFFVLAVLLTWLAWVPAALISNGVDSSAGRILLYVGGLGPVVALLMVLAPRGQVHARCDFVRRLTDLDALRAPATLLALVLPPLFGLLALLSYIATHDSTPALPSLSRPLVLALPILFFGPLPEELAWRGYGLPTLLGGYSPLMATLVTASIWGLWHVPLFVVPGTYQARLGWGAGGAWLFFGNLFTQSVLMTALLMASGSTWSAVFFHWTTNLTGEALQLPPAAEVHRAAWTLTAALLVVFLLPPFGVRHAVWSSRPHPALNGTVRERSPRSRHR